MLLDILIPTYNRSQELKNNLIYLIDEIITNNLNQDIRIHISDNCSSDNTEVVVKTIINSNKDVNIFYYRNSENIGLERNVVSVLSKATSEYIVWLGDDDILDKGYLKFCVDELQFNKNIGCIITGILKEYEDGTLVKVRNPGFNSKQLTNTFSDILNYSYLGHQLSGLVMKRESLLHDYLENDSHRNIYLFIYFVTNRMSKYETLYVPKFRTKVPVFNVKFWEYNQIGLLDEVFKSYYPFISTMGIRKVSKLISFFLIQQSTFRLNIERKHPLRLMMQYLEIIKCLPFKSTKLAIEIFQILLKEYILKFIR
ncbi:glycosyltransferase [Flammeovirga yaeyamensis]|uniref:Glycosyltransferase n=1 Tax=Flammeovirga yaeyamensis TaxID=367791 RepID=A0AAX1MY43_9BACT|nr:glycosyltransferase family 2 protein [Flammeovirga yaeyamensis]MBB3696335.1 glycosyltransferase involved in cell wall biosynthesis [Flammeovirga yaeyamensis]NMF35014.1 glycosyltransferase family 2 protein [Flammeovirga yaeyamensis]QWG00160.1 glycosyltransferase [Flammeovirga yaeyamensis]